MPTSTSTARRCATARRAPSPQALDLHALSCGMLLALGIAAATLTITSFLAQTWKILRTRDTRSLSTPTWIPSTTAFVIWVGYGVGLDAWFIIRTRWAACSPP